MRVHPAPMKRSITVRYPSSQSTLSAAAEAATMVAAIGRQKKLRRLPHIFSKVLELPFGSDADVSVHEGPSGFRFTAPAADSWEEVRAMAVEIHPGVMKVVIRHRDPVAAAGEEMDEEEDLPVDELELDRWRFRLPACTLPALATADCVNGELVVVIPKGDDDDSGELGAGDGGISDRLRIRRLVLFTQ